MTKEEIKATYSMRDVAARYGLVPNRSGILPCPFHQERDPSMKLYEKDFHCFACGANGDIFTFVQMMEDVDFKEAFQILGGTYEKPTFSSRRIVYTAKKQQEMRRKDAKRLRDRQNLNNMLIDIYRAHMDRSKPLSDVWCACYNALQYQLHIHECLNGIGKR